MKQQWNLRPLWDALLDIHDEVRAICVRHSIPYWAVGGTALGAMRHQGFIPWDDDFDIAMKRSDYELFMRVYSKELPAHMHCRCFELGDDSPLALCKIVDGRADLLERVQKETSLQLTDGIFLDIFPIDGLPSTSFGLKLFKMGRGLLRRFFPSTRFSRSLYCRYLRLFPVGSTTHCGISGEDSHKTQRCYWRKEWFDGTTMMKFDRTEVPMCKDTLAFISQHYRSWETLPPEKNRVPSHNVSEGGIIDF